MRWVAGVVVVAVVAAGFFGFFGFFGFLRWHGSNGRDQQRADYVAGHTALVRGDCATALPRLAAARAVDYDAWMAGLATVDGIACENYQKVRATAAGQAPEAALATYLAFVAGKPHGPLVSAARQQVREQLRKDIAAGSVSYRLCTRRSELTTRELVEINPADDLAAPWLAACATTMVKEKGWADARRALVELQTELPRSTEAKATLGELTSVSAKAAAGVPDAEEMSDLGSRSRDPGLKGQARLMLWNGSAWPLDVTIGGDHPRFVHLEGCPDCQAGDPKDDDCRVIRKSWKKTSITIPVGRRPLQAWSPSPEHWDFDSVAYATVDFVPNAIYGFCSSD